MTIGHYIKALGDFLLPRHCVVCSGTLGIYEDFLCLHCSSDLPLTYYWNRRINPMAERFNELIQRDLDEYRPYALACALFFYRSTAGYREITRGLKYHGNVPIGRHYADMLGRCLSLSDLYEDVDAVVPVPLHPARLRRRGYNQAEIIAERIAAALGVQCYPSLLLRVHRTGTQTILDSSARSSNVSSAFRINPKCSHPAFRHVLIVDDVFTTGATVNACYKVISQAFGTSVKISAATLACVMME